MEEFLTEEDCQPNMNSWTGAGRISKLEPLTGKTVGLAFSLDYIKAWPNGHDTWALKCYVSGQEKSEQVKRLDGQVVFLRGEVTPRGTIYCYAVDPFLPSPKGKGRRDAWEADDFPMPK